MNQTNSKKGWAIAILVLILINIATLITFWCTTKKVLRDHFPPPNGGGAAAFVIKELAFDSTQKLAYQALIEQHQQAIREIKEQVKDAKEAYFALLADTSASEETIKAAITKATTTEEQIDVKTFEHFKKVRALCIPEQKKKFDGIIKEVIGMMAPEKHQGPPPPRQNVKGGMPNDNPPFPNDGFPPPPPQ